MIAGGIHANFHKDWGQRKIVSKALKSYEVHLENKFFTGSCLFTLYYKKSTSCPLSYPWNFFSGWSLID